MMNEGTIITEQAIVEGYLSELQELTDRKEFYKERIAFINSQDFNFEKDKDLNIKSLSSRCAHITKAQVRLRHKIRLYNPEFELKK